MKFKVGDVIVSKERGPYEYGVVYRIVEIYNDNVVKLEVVPRNGFDRIKEEIEKDIEAVVGSVDLPPWAHVKTEVWFEKTFVDPFFDEDEWELAGDGDGCGRGGKEVV